MIKLLIYVMHLIMISMFSSLLQADKLLLIGGSSDHTLPILIQSDKSNNNNSSDLCVIDTLERNMCKDPSSKMHLMWKMMSPDQIITSNPGMEEHQDYQQLIQDNNSSNNNSSTSGVVIRVYFDCHTTKTPLFWSNP